MIKKALLKLADHIDEAGDKKFDLSCWARRSGGDVPDIEHLCGSTGCVCGWQNSLANAQIIKKLGINLSDFETLAYGIVPVLELPSRIADELRTMSDTAAAAADLGLTPAQAYELFTPWTRNTYGDHTVDDRRDSLNGPCPRTIWGKNAWEANSQRAAKLLRDIAFGRKTFTVDRPDVKAYIFDDGYFDYQSYPGKPVKALTK